jgi:hypothetical protein
MKIKYLVWLAAFLLAACAAIISVKGLALLFGGGIILYFIFGTMEGIKLITAGVLERFWSSLPKTLRTYLVGGVAILMLITSLGVYGFFSGNYQGVADQLTIEDGKIEMIENRITVFEDRKLSNKEIIDARQSQLDLLVKSESELRKGLVNNRNQTIDSLGRVIGTTDWSTRQKDKDLNKQLNDVNEKITKLNNEIDGLLETNTALSDSIITNKGKINEIKANSDITAEVGPLRYLSDITGLPMAKVVNILMMLIVFVFDPMAISLVILANKLDEIDSGKKPKIKKREFKDTVTHANIKNETFENEPEEEVIINLVEPVVNEPEPVTEETNIDPEPIKVESVNVEKPESDNLVNIGKKMLQKLVNNDETSKKQPIVLKGKITQEDVPQIKEGLNRGFSVKVPERKKK